MSNLLNKLKEAQKSYKTPVEETINVVITDIKPTRDDSRVMLVTNVGNIFAWKNTFAGGIPVIDKPLKAEVTLRENTTSDGKSYTNVSRVKYSLEEMGKYSFVATNKLTVAL